MEITEELEKLFESDHDGLFTPKKKLNGPSADDRLIESFKEIETFVEKNNHLPNIEANDFNESRLAQRLEAIRYNPEKVELLGPIDRLGLLVIPETPKSVDELFQQDPFSLFSGVGNDVLKVKKPLVAKPRPTPEYVSRRKRAKDFKHYEQGFHLQQDGLANGTLKLVRYKSIYQLKVNSYYIHDGQMLYVADIGEKKRVYDRNKERLRIIFENGTESDMYKRSLSARLYESGYAVVDANYVDASQMLDEGDEIKGYIYILVSKSIDPKITTIKNLYKIGYSTTPIATRIKNAENDPTYLMAPVEVVASYVVTNKFNPQKIEYFLHRIFAEVSLDMNIIGPNGHEYKPLEWFSVPLQVIDMAVNLLQSGEIVDYVYDLSSESLVLTN